MWRTANPAPGDVPLLVGGQSATNGVDGVSWTIDDPDHVYVEVGGGTSILTYAFLGAGAADGVVSRASLRMMVPSVAFVSMHDTFNPANRIPNPTPKDDPPAVPANKLYLVESADSSCYQASLKISCDPPEALNRVVCAVYRNGEKVPNSDAQFLPDGTATLVFEHPSSHDSDVIDFTVSAGYDVNGNGLLDDFETLIPLRVKFSGADIGPAIIRGTSAPRYGTALTQVNGIVNGTVTAPGWATSLMIPHAKALLRIFHQGNPAGTLGYAPTGTNTVSLNAFAPVSGFSEWLTHNAGAPFNPSGGRADQGIRLGRHAFHG
ncbi:MAG: hypothetical protein ACOX6A_04225 [Atribacter sp.]|uniref:hypothetical protein n=1 Tax=Atribacter sp. TaxID=2847780 RepID=UPI003D9595C4